MGLTEGCRMVVRVLGDPCIVEVRTTRIGLAKSVAERLYVRAERPEGR
jgi:Fe2+ transport system protein FeoA